MKDLVSTAPAARAQRGGAMTPFSTFRREMDRLFDNFGAVGFTDSPFSFLAPEIDYAETDKEIVISAELPGVESKDVDVSLRGDTLTIRGEKRSSRDEKTENYRCAERSFGSFERSIGLPPGIDATQVDAHFTDGVLKITMPKPKANAESGQKIAIKAN